MTKGPKRVAIYLRTSHTERTVENQRRELAEASERHGWNVVQTFADEGISGAKGRDGRPGFDALCQGIARRQFDMVASWSVDRLGRSLQDLIAFLGELRGKGVDLYLHRQGLDTSTPAGRALFQMMGVFAEFERAMIQERVRAGMARARAQGKALGRPVERHQHRRKVMVLRGKGVGIRKIAKTMGIGVGTVKRVLGEQS